MQVAAACTHFAHIILQHDPLEIQLGCPQDILPHLSLRLPAT
jgi:hypothetical protein